MCDKSLSDFSKSKRLFFFALLSEILEREKSFHQSQTLKYNGRGQNLGRARSRLLSVPSKMASMMAEILIEEVKNCTFLYDPEHADYKNSVRKTASWEAIGKVIGVSGGNLL